MLRVALVLAAAAVGAAFLGFGGVLDAAAGVGQVLALILLTLTAIALLLAAMVGRRPRT
jgi:uncharacterized membrane protein YtjA (UPF0391 family)